VALEANRDRGRQGSKRREHGTMSIQGGTEPGFEAVRDAFAANFEAHGEAGAACCVYVQGRPVVDLWGGVADAHTDRAWDSDTLQLVFSATKGATAICALRLVEQGLLDLDAPVGEYWPEFKMEGKEGIPVRWLLSHRSGLPVVDAHLTPNDVFAWQPMVSALAAQRPVWEPGTAHGYHALTYGFLVGEVVRRVSGRTPGQFLADEVAGPLGLDLWIGLPPDQERRVSRLIRPEPISVPEGFDLNTLPEEARQMVGAFLDPNSLTMRALTVTEPAIDWNDPAAHGAEIPAANGICSARSLAKMYAAVIGEVDGVRLLSPATLQAATTEQSAGPDRVLFVSTRFGLGFMLHAPFSSMLGPSSFGHSGAGGSLGFADPESGVAFAYVMNRMRQQLGGDPRPLALVNALRGCLA
jgi:CubicO group peptidase (beta-lactamase class C family)